MKFSANLGFLWTELALPEAIRAAKAAGFDAVELHAPDVPAPDIRAASVDTGLPVLGLNTAPHNSFGCAALPDQSHPTRADIDAAVAYAVAVDARYIHVLAGIAEGSAARACYLAALKYAVAAATPRGLTILIEPINAHDVPGYHLQTTRDAIDVIDAVGEPNLKLMFDCYHVARSETDVSSRMRACFLHIGHIQFAGVPDRGRPDGGALNYKALFDLVTTLGWTAPMGAEYRPAGPTEATLGWMEALS